MPLSLSDVVRTSYLGGLGSLRSVLSAAEAYAGEEGLAESDLLGSRLAEDMFTFSQQIQTATDNARRGIDRLVGRELSSRPDPEPSFAGLSARVEETIAHVQAASADAIDASCDRAMSVNLGAGPMDFTGRSYALGFGIPNFLFHVTTAYALMRQRGVPLGKVLYISPFIGSAGDD